MKTNHKKKTISPLQKAINEFEKITSDRQENITEKTNEFYQQYKVSIFSKRIECISFIKSLHNKYLQPYTSKNALKIFNVKYSLIFLFTQSSLDLNPELLDIIKNLVTQITVDLHTFVRKELLDLSLNRSSKGNAFIRYLDISYLVCAYTIKEDLMHFAQLSYFAKEQQFNFLDSLFHLNTLLISFNFDIGCYRMIKSCQLTTERYLKAIKEIAQELPHLNPHAMGCQEIFKSIQGYFDPSLTLSVKKKLLFEILLLIFENYLVLKKKSLQPDGISIDFFEDNSSLDKETNYIKESQYIRLLSDIKGDIEPLFIPQKTKYDIIIELKIFKNILEKINTLKHLPLEYMRKEKSQSILIPEGLEAIKNILNKTIKEFYLIYNFDDLFEDQKSVSPDQLQLLNKVPKQRLECCLGKNHKKYNNISLFVSIKKELIKSDISDKDLREIERKHSTTFRQYRRVSSFFRWAHSNLFNHQAYTFEQFQNNINLCQNLFKILKLNPSMDMNQKCFLFSFFFELHYKLGYHFFKVAHNNNSTDFSIPSQVKTLNQMNKLLENHQLSIGKYWDNYTKKNRTSTELAKTHININLVYYEARLNLFYLRYIYGLVYPISSTSLFPDFYNEFVKLNTDFIHLTEVAQKTNAPISTPFMLFFQKEHKRVLGKFHHIKHKFLEVIDQIGLEKVTARFLMADYLYAPNAIAKDKHEPVAKENYTFEEALYFCMGFISKTKKIPADVFLSCYGSFQNFDVTYEKYGFFKDPIFKFYFETLKNKLTSHPMISNIIPQKSNSPTSALPSNPKKKKKRRKRKKNKGNSGSTTNEIDELTNKIKEISLDEKKGPNYKKLLEQKNSEFIKLQKKYELLQAQLKKLKSDQSQLTQKVSNLSSSLSKNQSGSMKRNTELKRIKSELNQKNIKINQQKNTIAKLGKQIKSLEHINSMQKADNTFLSRQLDTFKKEIERITTSLESSQLETKTIQDELDTLIKQVNVLKNTISQLKSDKQHLNTQNSSLLTKNKSLQQQINTLTRALKEEKEAHQQHITRLKKTTPVTPMRTQTLSPTPSISYEDQLKLEQKYRSSDHSIRLSNNAHKILELLHKKKIYALVYGGFPRDTLLGLQANDLDLCAFMRLTPENIQYLNSIDFIQNRKRLTLFQHRDYNIDLSIVHPSKSIETFASEFDFTINTFFLNRDGHVLDPLKFISHLKNNFIVPLKKDGTTISEDPYRIFRAICLANQTGKKISAQLNSLFVIFSSQLPQEPIGRYFKGIQKLFTGPLAVQNLNYLVNHYSILSGIFPFLRSIHIPANSMYAHFCFAQINNLNTPKQNFHISGYDFFSLFLAIYIWNTIIQVPQLKFETLFKTQMNTFFIYHNQNNQHPLSLEEQEKITRTISSLSRKFYNQLTCFYNTNVSQPHPPYAISTASPQSSSKLTFIRK